tara:strand:+ start:283 stop:789 length:507 start_codon:yes stop_codon:yes gene_type:complete
LTIFYLNHYSRKKLNDYDKAISLIDEGIKKIEDKYDLHYYGSLIKLETNEFDAALKRINNCIEISPNDPASYYAEYLIYNKQGKTFKALTSLEKAISRKNKFQDDFYIPSINGDVLELWDLYFYRAEVYQSFGEFDLMCEELSTGCNLTNCNNEKYKQIKQRISKECK